MPRKSVSQKSTETRDRLSALAAVTGSVTGVGPASEVIREVESVPTCFPYVDRVLGVGGFPIARVCTIQGPSNKGKSTFCLGLIRSFLQAQHPCLFIDAERSTPKSYARLMIGEELYDLPIFQCPQRIGTYENVRALVRSWTEAIGNAREKGSIPEDTTGLVVVDSLHNLFPSTIMEELEKASKAAKEPKDDKKIRFKQPKGRSGVDGMSGMAGMIQAGFNTAWLKELTSLLADTRCAIAIIVRENEVEEGKGLYAKTMYEPVGGKEVKFAPSLRLRVESKPIYEEADGEGTNVLVGERHRVMVEKTKVSGKKDRIPESWFHTSNGRIAPEGFDRARDVFALATSLGVIEQRGAYYYFDGSRLGQGEGMTLRELRKPSVAESVEKACRELKSEILENEDAVGTE